MRRITRRVVVSVAFGLAVLAGGTGTPVALAANPAVNATGGNGTAVDRDGTQGSFTDAVQGVVDTDGDQDAYLITSEEAAPQVKAPHQK